MENAKWKIEEPVSGFSRDHAALFRFFALGFLIFEFS
jgi:hypothetical protein